MRPPRPFRTVACGLAAAALTVTMPAAPSSASPAPAARAAAINPLAAGPWGVTSDGADGVYPAWQAATGPNKGLLAKIALRPRVRWFGAWIPTDKVSSSISGYIAGEQHGYANVLVQLAIFRVFPTGEGRVGDPLSAAAQNAYRSWVNAAARGIGRARVALVLEPDLAVSRNGWRPAVRYALARYAAKTFSALPHTSVYIDASAPDWLQVPDAVAMLKASGVSYARGFALNATHYTSTADNLGYGVEISRSLASNGIAGKHFVINTADTGRPFTWAQYWTKHPHGNFDNAQVCQSRSEPRCVTLGIPPTANVAARAWGLPASVLPGARAWCDAYLWFGRPWLDYQASPFDLARSLQIARTTPF